MLDSKQRRIAPWASVLLTSFTFVSAFFIFSAVRSPLRRAQEESSSMLVIEEFKDSSSSSSSINNDEKVHETMELNMERLVLEKNMAKFQAQGFTCQTEQNSDQCITSKNTRIEITNAQITIVDVPSSSSPPSPSGQQTIEMKPYALKDHESAMQMVSTLQINLMGGNLTDTTTTCQYNHTVPAVVFSSGGYAVNTYHALDEFLIPLFLTTRHFNSNIQFFVTDFDPRVIPKYSRFLRRLSRFEPIDSSSSSSSENNNNGTSTSTTHCFPGAVIGLNKHGNVVVNSSDIPTGYTMDDFRRFMYESYNLNPTDLEMNPTMKRKKPLLVLITRARTRVIVNVKQVVKLMKEVGFKVHVALDDEMSDLDRFSRLLSRTSVLVGTHGAGLSNSVFMPKGTVLLQVVPLGLRGAGIFCHGDPASRMGLRYVEYLIEPKESSLSEAYGPDDPVLLNPDSVLSKGYQEARGLYIDGQNVTINLTRFRGTLLEVLRGLRPSLPPGRNTTDVLDQN